MVVMGSRLLAIGGLMFFSASVFAGRDQWTTTGPPGGAQVIAADPTRPAVVYALGGDLFQSIDGGQTWKGRNLFLAFPYRFTVAPSNPEVIYVGSLEGRIKKTLDAGWTWIEVDSGLPNDAIVAIAVDPKDAAT